MWKHILWKHEVKYPLLGGRSGFWNAYENDAVWEILEPCLQLATRLIYNAHMHPWWDALISKDWQQLDDAELTEDHVKDLAQGKFYRFRRRPAFEASSPNQPKADFVELFAMMNTHLKLGLMSSAADPRTGLPNDSPGSYSTSTNYGMTLPPYSVTKDITMLLSYQLLEPLFRNDLTDAEKLLSRFEVASTIYHEFAVSAAFILVLFQRNFGNKDIFTKGDSMRLVLVGEIR